MAKSERCPYGCARCRAHEMGLGGRGLTQEELIAVGGGLIEQSRDDRVQWSAETAEAALAVELAEIAYENAKENYGDVLRKKAASDDTLKREQLDEAAGVLRADLDDVGDDLSAARSRYYSLAQRDSRLHWVAIYEADQAAQAKAREEAKKARASGGRRVLGLIGGGK